MVNYLVPFFLTTGFLVTVFAFTAVFASAGLATVVVSVADTLVVTVETGLVGVVGAGFTGVVVVVVVVVVVTGFTGSGSKTGATGDVGFGSGLLIVEAR